MISTSNANDKNIVHNSEYIIKSSAWTENLQEKEGVIVGGRNISDTKLHIPDQPDQMEMINVVNNSNFSSMMHNFFSDVSVVGLKYVALGGASWIRRFIWLLLVLFGVGFMSFQVR
jgi:hypothetical protein